MSYDLLIKNARIIDGTGTGSFIGDVGIKGDTIALVGVADAGATRVIDAAGRALAPGFIDTHTHYDGQLFWDPLLTSTSWHGFTTAVMGHCGLTLAPLRSRDRSYIAQAFSRVEDIPLDLLQEYVDWQWESYPEYVAALQQRPYGINVVPQVGHSALRRWVMGDDYQREARPDEIEQMRELLRASLRAGAGGFTSSHGPHVDMNDIPVASRFSTRDELLALASVMGEENVGVYQMSTKTLREGLLEDERAFLEDLSRTTRRPATLNGLEHRKSNCLGWLEWLDQAAKRGARMRSNVQVMGIEGRFLFNTLNVTNQRSPKLVELARLSAEEAAARLARPEYRAGIRQELIELPKESLLRPSWEKCWVSIAALPKNKHLEGKAVADLAREAGREVVDYVLDLALEEGLATEFRFGVVEDGSPELARAVARSPYTLMGVSDGGAHLGSQVTTHVSTYFLGEWVRRQQLLSLEEAVQKLTFVPAATYGLSRRGLILEGYFADLVVFDPETIDAGPAITAHDLPGGRTRMIRQATGIPYVIVNGKVVLDQGAPTEHYPGRVLLNRLAQG